MGTTFPFTPFNCTPTTSSRHEVLCCCGSPFGIGISRTLPFQYPNHYFLCICYCSIHPCSTSNPCCPSIPHCCSTYPLNPASYSCYHLLWKSDCICPCSSQCLCIRTSCAHSSSCNHQASPIRSDCKPVSFSR